MNSIITILREALPELVGGVLGATVIALASRIYTLIKERKSTDIENRKFWVYMLVACIVGIVLIVSASQLFGEFDVLIVVSLSIIVGLGWSACVYVVFKTKVPRVHVRKKFVTWQYPKLRYWGMAGFMFFPLLAVIFLGYIEYQRGLPPDKVVILVAEFEGPLPESYKVSEILAENLDAAVSEYQDIEVILLEGRTNCANDACPEIEDYKAAILIWGWYGVTSQSAVVSVNFEALRAPEYMPELGPEVQGQTRLAELNAVEDYTLQLELSDEVAYLTLFVIGLAQYSDENWDTAIDLFTAALNDSYKSVSALDQSVVYISRAAAYRGKGEKELAIADYNEAINLDPDSTIGYHNRGMIYLYMRKSSQALEDFNKVIELDPSTANAYHNRGIIYYRRGMYDQAIADYDMAIKLNPQDPMSYSERAWALDAKGDLDQALEDHNMAIMLSSEPKYAIYKRGITYFDNNMHTEAIDDFSEVIDIDPETIPAYFYRGQAYVAFGEYDLAEKDYNYLISIEPEVPDVYSKRAELRMFQGNITGAISDYSNAIQYKADLDPDDKFLPHAYVLFYGRAQAYLIEEKYESAIFDLTKTLEYEPDLYEALLLRGQAYFLIGDDLNAVEDLSQLIVAEPDKAQILASAYYHRALAYKKLGLLFETVPDLEKALILTDDPDVKRNIENMLNELR